VRASIFPKPLKESLNVKHS